MVADSDLQYFRVTEKDIPFKKVINLSSQMKTSKMLKLLLTNYQPIFFAENMVLQ